MNERITFYKEGTPAKVKEWLERIMHTERRVRLFYGDMETGRYWGDEYMVMGTIGRSTGTQPIPLLIDNARSLGGPAILTHCIVRMFVKSRIGWQEVYRHPTYNSIYESAEVRVSEMAPEYSHAVFADGSEVARFHSEKSAQNYLEFMRGNRFKK